MYVVVEEDKDRNLTLMLERGMTLPAESGLPAYESSMQPTKAVQTAIISAS